MLPLIHLTKEESERAQKVAEKMIASAKGISFAELDAAIDLVKEVFEKERVGTYRSTIFNPDSIKKSSG